MTAHQSNLTRLRPGWTDPVTHRVSKFVSHAENGSADVSARLGFGRGFGWIGSQGVVYLVAIDDELSLNDRFWRVSDGRAPNDVPIP